MSVVERFAFKCNVHPDTVAERVYFPKCNRYKWKCCGRQCREHPRGDVVDVAGAAAVRDDGPVLRAAGALLAVRDDANAHPAQRDAFDNLMDEQYKLIGKALAEATADMEELAKAHVPDKERNEKEVEHECAAACDEVEARAEKLKQLSQRARVLAQSKTVAQRLLAASAYANGEPEQLHCNSQELQEKAMEAEQVAEDMLRAAYSCRDVPIYQGSPFASCASTWYRIWVKYPDGVQSAGAVMDVLSMFDEYHRGNFSAIEMCARASGVTGQKQLQCFAKWINQNLCKIAVEPSSSIDFQLPKNFKLPKDVKKVPDIVIDHSALQEITSEAFQRIIDNIDLESEKFVEKLTGAFSALSLASQLATLASFPCERSTDAQLLVLACASMFAATVFSVLPRVTSVWDHKRLLFLYCLANAASFLFYFKAVYNCNGPTKAVV